MKNFLKSKYFFCIVLLLAFILRIIPAFSAVSDEKRLIRPDSSGYLEPAVSMVENGSFSTTRRPPGYPLFASAVYFCGGNNSALVFIQVLISVAACAVTVCAAKAYSGSAAAGNCAGLLAALNITAIANAPLLLSDTLFSLFAALQFLFFIRYKNSCNFPWLLATAATAAIATLIRPINQLFIIVLIVLIFFIPQISWKKKIIHSLSALILFLLIITPWMLRNYLSGATFDIDTNTGAMRHQNGAMLMAKVNGTDFESEKAGLLKIEAETFADTQKFPDEKSKEIWRKEQFRKMVFAHPFIYFSQHFDPFILLPDAPTLLESFGITSSDRGTMGVLKKDGIFAAVKHYFGENFILILLFLIPLLVPVMILYLAVLWQLFRDVRNWKSAYPELLIFLAFVEYYLFLPGAITAPRYQLPALPCLCTLAACAILTILRKKNDPQHTIQTEI